MKAVPAALLVGLGLVCALATIYLGLPDVAATSPHWRITEWVLSTTMENAVRRRAEGIRVPDDLSDPDRVRSGAKAYDAMCVDCHAAPGVEPGVLAEGLLPPPPALAEEVEEWSPAELFWITRHGVRMTGMPAFGPTHEDRALWDVVAFLRRFPGLKASEYEDLVEGDRDGRDPEPAHGGHPESGHAH